MSDRFFFFPICLLAPPDPSPKITLQRVISYCIVHTGQKSVEAMGDIEVDGILSTLETPDDFTSDNDEHRAIAIGAKTLGVKIQSAEGILRECKEARDIERLHLSYGALVWAQIATELLWDCHNEVGLNYRDLCTLCAVNSVIGRRRTPVLVRRSVITARQIGFKTPAAWKARHRNRKMFREALTTSELRTSLDHLEQRGLLTRVIVSPRKTYFCWGKVDRMEMRKQVKAAQETSMQKLKIERAKDLAFMRGQPEADGF